MDTQKQLCEAAKDLSLLIDQLRAFQNRLAGINSAHIGEPCQQIDQASTLLDSAWWTLDKASS